MLKSVSQSNVNGLALVVDDDELLMDDGLVIDRLVN